MQQGVQEHQQRAQRIEELIEQIAAFTDSHMRDTTEELIQALLDMYGEGLARVLELTMQTERTGEGLIEAFARDDLLSSLFLLHGLHPIDIEARIAQALDAVRPYLKSHGGNVELIRVENAIAYLRLEGSCHGCPSSTATLKLAIEDAIYKAAPDLEGLEVEGVTDPPPRPGIPVTFVPRRHKDGKPSAEQDSGWSVVARLEPLPAGTLKMVTVQKNSLLFCQIDGTYYAYHNHCSGCNAPLDVGRLVGTTLICTSCGRQYDISGAGRCLDAVDLFLRPLPLIVEDDNVKVALSSLAKDDPTKATLSAFAR